jgi:hypothetical protein
MAVKVIVLKQKTGCELLALELTLFASPLADTAAQRIEANRRGTWTINAAETGHQVVFQVTGSATTQASENTQAHPSFPQWDSRYRLHDMWPSGVPEKSGA